MKDFTFIKEMDFEESKRYFMYLWKGALEDDPVKIEKFEKLAEVMLRERFIVCGMTEDGDDTVCIRRKKMTREELFTFIYNIHERFFRNQVTLKSFIKMGCKIFFCEGLTSKYLYRNVRSHSIAKMPTYLYQYF